MALKYTPKQLNDKVFIFHFVKMGVCTDDKEMKSVVKGHQRGFFGGGNILSLVVTSKYPGKQVVYSFLGGPEGNWERAGLKDHEEPAIAGQM